MIPIRLERADGGFVATVRIPLFHSRQATEAPVGVIRFDGECYVPFAKARAEWLPYAWTYREALVYVVRIGEEAEGA